MLYKRIFVIVLDSLGVGEAQDAINYGDTGANTLGNIKANYDLFVPNLEKIGFLDTISMSDNQNVDAYYTIAKPNNAGKDSINGHYEMFGVKNTIPFQTYNNGFTFEILNNIEEITGRRVLGNKSAQPIDIINELGERQVNYGSLIIYTSANSDLSISAHEDSIPLPTLYQYAESIRALTLTEDFRIGTVTARPFTGIPGKYKLINSAKREYSLKPPAKSVLESLVENKYNVIGIGKINNLMAGVGITKQINATSNEEAINKLNDIIDKDFTGLCVTNLSDFDTYGHMRDLESYANKIEEVDVEISMLLNKIENDDLVIITADHGNDPTFTGSNHTRENVPVIIYSREFKHPKRLKEFNTLANIGATIADNFNIELPKIGISILDDLM